MGRRPRPNGPDADRGARRVRRVAAARRRFRRRRAPLVGHRATLLAEEGLRLRGLGEATWRTPRPPSVRSPRGAGTFTGASLPRPSVSSPGGSASGGTEDGVSQWRVARAQLPRSPAARPRRPLSASDPAPNPDELRQRRFPSAETEGLLGDLARIGAATREESLAERALSALEDRRLATVPALRAELAALRRKAAPPPETLLGGGLAVTRLLPKDLTWDLYAGLDAEDVP